MTDYSWPTNFVPTSSALTWHDNTVTFISPLSGQMRTESRPGGKWKLQLTLDAWKNETVGTRVSVHELEAFLFKLNGAENRAVIPDFSYARKSTATGGRVQGASVTGKTITTFNWSPQDSTVLYAGDRFTLDNQMHVVASDVTATGDNATITLAHPHRTPTTYGATLDLTQPTARYVLTNKVGFASQPGVFKSVMLEFEEAIP